MSVPAYPPTHPPDQIVRIRWDLYIALKRLREDFSYPTFDHLIREAVREKYPHLDI